jgi:tetratricopeptide (TPR) repeat protein
VRADTWFRAAEELAGDDRVELSKIHAVRGARYADAGAHDLAVEALQRSIELAAETEQTKQEAWSTAMLGRTHLLRNELEAGDAALERAIELTAAERWTTFAAFPEALRAEVWVRRCDLDRAAEAFEHAFALGCQVDDACWEAYGVRGLGLLNAASGDLAGAIRTMGDALTRCARQRDTHLWLRAYVLDALCAVAVMAEHPTAARWVTDLASISGRSGMRELSVRHTSIAEIWATGPRSRPPGCSRSASRTLTCWS